MDSIEITPDPPLPAYLTIPFNIESAEPFQGGVSRLRNSSSLSFLTHSTGLTAAPVPRLVGFPARQFRRNTPAELRSSSAGDRETAFV